MNADSLILRNKVEKLRTERQTDRQMDRWVDGQINRTAIVTPKHSDAGCSVQGSIQVAWAQDLGRLLMTGKFFCCRFSWQLL